MVPRITCTGKTSWRVGACRVRVAIIVPIGALIYIGASDAITLKTRITGTKKTSFRIGAIRVGVAIVASVRAFINILACAHITSIARLAYTDGVLAIRLVRSSTWSFVIQSDRRTSLLSVTGVCRARVLVIAAKLLQARACASGTNI